VIVSGEELRERCLGSRVVLELGFGRGELLLDLAEAAPLRVFVGVEISRKRVEKVAKRAEKRAIANLWLLHAPAEYALERVLPPGCVEECWINCPDPWPKKRHWRRRLVQPLLVERLAAALAPGALLHIATDHPGYRDWISEVMGVQSGFVNLHGTPWSESPPARRETAYEAEWRAEGRALAYFDYRRTP
jgi:tRNA (guanine-N7-)-methyltransferase